MYEGPDAGPDVATLTFDPFPRLGSGKYVHVLTIDDGLVARSRKAIRLQTGLRKIQVRACGVSLLLPGWYCGEVFFRLQVVAGGAYRVQGEVVTRDDYADLWIEDSTGNNSVGPLRVQGLTRMDTLYVPLVP